MTSSELPVTVTVRFWYPGRKLPLKLGSVDTSSLSVPAGTVAAIAHVRVNVVDVAAVCVSVMPVSTPFVFGAST